MNVNLISVGAIQENGYSVTFKSDRVSINRETDNECALQSKRMGRSYLVEFTAVGNAYSARGTTPVSKKLLHDRLGHTSPRIIDTLTKKNLISVTDNQIENSKIKDCVACMEGKMTRRQFNETENRVVNRKLDLVHSDLCGPMSVPSLGGARYFLVLVDDLTRFTYVAFLKKKSDTLQELKAFIALMSNQGHGAVRAIRTDNGTEYVNGALKDYLTSKGIVHQTSAPYTPEQNGLAERTNRTLIEKARCMLQHAQLSKEYWAEAIATACYLKNITPSRVINDEIPKSKFTGQSISYGHLRTFGCVALVHTPKEKRKKFDPVSRACIFVGYTSTAKQYRFIDAVTKRLVVSATAIFQEDKICEAKGSSVRLIHNIQEGHADNSTLKLDIGPVGIDNIDTESPSQSGGDINTSNGNLDPAPQTPPQQLRRSTRHSTPPKRLTYEYADTDDDGDVAAMFSSVTNEEELSYYEATTGRDAKKWETSMKVEYDALMNNKTWKLVPLPQGKKVIPCRWIFKIKPATRAEPKIFKSRLVAKGFRQVYGVDYDDTFAPVVRLSGLRILLSVAVNLKMHVHGMDVKNAFLNSPLEHEVYMQQPEGFVKESKPNYVCLLKKAVYGLKQSPRQWYNTVKPVLESVGVSASHSSCGLFSGDVDNSKVLLAIYVDNLFIACDSMQVMNTIKSKLSSRFHMKDLGLVKHYLGMDINYQREDGVVILSQSHYVTKILKRFSMSDCKSVATPMESKLILSPHEDGATELTSAPYRQLIGSVMYLMLCTRPDVSYSVGLLSRFLSSPTDAHWSSAKRLLRYLHGTLHMQLSFRHANHCNIVGYCDADWASSSDRKSTSGYVIYVGGNLVSWKSKRQSTVALSSTEAEIVAATESIREILWIGNILKSFGIPHGKPKLFCDNHPAISMANSYGYNSRSKHMNVKYKFLSESVANNSIEITYIPTEQNIADMLTKPLPRTKFATLIPLMDLGS